MVILVVFKVFLVVKNLEILIQIVPERPIYYYFSAIENIQRVDRSPKIKHDAICNPYEKNGIKKC